MATRKKKAASPDAKKLTRSDMKVKIRALKKQREEAGSHSARAKVNEFNQQLRIWRRKLRRAARHKAA